MQVYFSRQMIDCGSLGAFDNVPAPSGVRMIVQRPTQPACLHLAAYNLIFKCQDVKTSEKKWPTTQSNLSWVNHRECLWTSAQPLPPSAVELRLRTHTQSSRNLSLTAQLMPSSGSSWLYHTTSVEKCFLFCWDCPSPIPYNLLLLMPVNLLLLLCLRDAHQFPCIFSLFFMHSFIDFLTSPKMQSCRMIRI